MTKKITKYTKLLLFAGIITLLAGCGSDSGTSNNASGSGHNSISDKNGLNLPSPTPTITSTDNTQNNLEYCKAETKKHIDKIKKLREKSEAALSEYLKNNENEATKNLDSLKKLVLCIESDFFAIEKDIVTIKHSKKTSIHYGYLKREYIKTTDNDIKLPENLKNLMGSLDTIFKEAISSHANLINTIKNNLKNNKDTPSFFSLSKLQTINQDNLIHEEQVYSKEATNFQLGILKTNDPLKVIKEYSGGTRNYSSNEEPADSIQTEVCKPENNGTPSWQDCKNEVATYKNEIMKLKQNSVKALNNYLDGENINQDYLKGALVNSTAAFACIENHLETNNDYMIKCTSYNTAISVRNYLITLNKKEICNKADQQSIDVRCTLRNISIQALNLHIGLMNKITNTLLLDDETKTLYLSLLPEFKEINKPEFVQWDSGKIESLLNKISSKEITKEKISEIYGDILPESL